MGDMGDIFRDMKELRSRLRQKFGVKCPVCVVRRPKANATILLPQQRCKVDGYVDSRSEDILNV